MNDDNETKQGGCFLVVGENFFFGLRVSLFFQVGQSLRRKQDARFSLSHSHLSHSRTKNTFPSYQMHILPGVFLLGRNTFTTPYITTARMAYRTVS